MTMTSAITTAAEAGVGNSPSAKKVAALIAGVACIGTACETLRNAGWRSTIAGNRITVNDRVFARYIDAGADNDGARWLVYGIGDQPPVCIVAAHQHAL